MQPEPHPPFGNHNPLGSLIAAATITKGMLLILDNSGGGVGRVKPFAAANADFDTDSLEGGFVGFATADYATGELVTFQKILGGMMYAMETYTTAPTATLLGVAPTTYYTLRNDAGTVKVNLGTTTKGCVRFEEFDLTDQALSDVSPNVIGADTGGAAGDRILVSFPASVRHYQ